jgi:hypothetical protein
MIQKGLIKYKAGRHPENQGIKANQKECKTKPGEYFQSILHQIMTKVSKSLSINLLN